MSIDRHRPRTPTCGPAGGAHMGIRDFLHHYRLNDHRHLRIFQMDREVVKTKDGPVMQEHPLFGNPCQASFNRGRAQAFAEMNQKLIEAYPDIWDVTMWLFLFAAVFAVGWWLRGHAESRR